MSITIIILEIYLAVELWRFLRIFAVVVVVEVKQMISKTQKRQNCSSPFQFLFCAFTYIRTHRKCKNYGFGVWKKMMMFFWLKAKQTKWKLPKSLKHSEASIISAHVSIPSSTHFTLHFIFLPKANMSELRYAWTTFRKCFSSHSAYIDHCTKSTCIDFARCFRFCLKWILESKCFWKGIKGKYHGICERFYSERAHFDFMKILAKENNVRNVTIEIA